MKTECKSDLPTDNCTSRKIGAKGVEQPGTLLVGWLDHPRSTIMNATIPTIAPALSEFAQGISTSSLLKALMLHPACLPAYLRNRGTRTRTVL